MSKTNTIIIQKDNTIIIQKDKPSIIYLEQICYGCPSAWEGKTLCGKEIYIRYRWGCLSASLDDKCVFAKQIGDDFDGIISQEEIYNYLNNIFDFNIEDTKDYL